MSVWYDPLPLQNLFHICQAENYWSTTIYLQPLKVIFQPPLAIRAVHPETYT